MEISAFLKKRSVILLTILIIFLMITTIIYAAAWDDGHGNEYCKGQCDLEKYDQVKMSKISEKAPTGAWWYSRFDITSNETYEDEYWEPMEVDINYAHCIGKKVPKKKCPSTK